ncbi:MAG: hypothetical protein ACPF9D_05835 [Owenweeksia sp.]
MNLFHQKVLLRVKSRKEVLEVRQMELNSYMVLKTKEFLGISFVRLKRSFSTIGEAQLFLFQLEAGE